VPGFIPWAWTKQNNFRCVIHIHTLWLMLQWLEPAGNRSELIWWKLTLCHNSYYCYNYVGWKL
jgi:hypothetical protein